MSAADRWASGDAYERYVGRWSRRVGPIFLDWLAPPPGARWLDVGCGTGVLTEAILALRDPASVVGVDPSASFIEHARSRIADPRARFEIGSAGEVPLAPAEVDVAVAGLVLNFVPDLDGALRELRRVVAPGGLVGGYVWDYSAAMEFMRRFWDAAIALDPEGAATAEDEGARFPICAPGPLRAAFSAAGLTEVAVRPIDIATVFADFDDYWDPFLGGTGPAPVYTMSLDDERRIALREALRSTLPAEPDGSIHLVARTWAVRGTSPGA